MSFINVLLYHGTTREHCTDPDSQGPLSNGDGQFRGAADIDIDPKTGHVFVTDVNNQRIQKFDNNGVFISKRSLSGIP